MKLNDLTNARLQNHIKDIFIHDLFCDDIWGDNGEDCATVRIQPKQEYWHLHYTRTQSGIPYPFAQYTSIVIDNYEKQLNDDELVTFLTMHNLQNQFFHYIKE